MDRTKNRITCFCARRPLLGMYGLDQSRRPYIHVKVFKQNRVYAEFISYGGEVKIRCRECYRWHRIIFSSEVTGNARLEEVETPSEIDQEDLSERAHAC